MSLVGCPGTGKTWCGWLVAYTLQQKGKKTLHLAIRNSDVTAIVNFETKKQHKKVSWNENMLEQVLRESECQVCIVDVSMNEAVEAGRIFTGIQQLIERNEKEFAQVKFMGLLSGHGQETITGKQLGLQVIQKLVASALELERRGGCKSSCKDERCKLGASRRCLQGVWRICAVSLPTQRRRDQN